MEGEKRFVFNPVVTCPYLGSISKESGDQLDGIVLSKQQDDPCENFYKTIVNKSLESVVREKTKEENTQQKSVIIVGAGLAGLSAAFELKKVGYKVTILERQNRVGGRTKTLRDGFSDELHAEGGAMRIPKAHYLTHAYIDKFAISTEKFVNYNKKGNLFLEGKDKITMKEWKTKNKHYSDLWFKGWDSNLKDIIKEKVNGILDLYTKTFEPVKKDLFTLMEDKKDKTKGWEEWVNKWSVLSVEDFLRSKDKYPDISPDYRPWTPEAIKGYQMSSYSPEFGINLADHMRDEVGGWLESDLTTPTDGMDSIAKSFIKPAKDIKENEMNLAKEIVFGVNVHSIKRNVDKVTVSCRNVFTGMDKSFTANAVIVTVPLTILRHIDIDLEEKKRIAIRDINYGAATKIVLQYKRRFWVDTLGYGGFSKTDLPIGQLHYPMQNENKTDRGLLVCYTWGQDAHVFGAKPAAAAVEHAVSQVNKIHPGSIDDFEVGMVQAWFNDETSQGAYVSLKPFQYIESLRSLMTPNHPIYLAGEAISYTNAWIQGALESGLNAAFELYCHDSGSVPIKYEES